MTWYNICNFIMLTLTLRGGIYGGIFLCHHLSDNDVDLSDLYVDLSVIYVDLSDNYVDLSEKYHHN